tara:strand:+ start:606 stop:1085 length:480 start_codon:yes stop_codon:yes gene_type:complete
MARKKKAPVYQYGIEIVKPHSNEMYDHNEKVALDMKINIVKAWGDALSIVDDISVEEWDADMLKEHAPMLIKLQEGVMYSGYGTGYTIKDVSDEFDKEVQDAENWRMHEMYQELVQDGLIEKVEFEMVGFTNNYNKDYPTYAIGGKQLSTPKTAKLFVD